MKVKIEPSAPKGIVSAPPSKSMAHRYLFAAALAEGVSVIENVPENEDVSATLDCLGALGVRGIRKGTSVSVYGQGARFTALDVLNCRECGSSLRFVLPLCFGLDADVSLTGSKTLFSRPLSVYEDVARKQGLLWKKEKNTLTVGGELKSGEFVFPGNVSSQFVTGLLLKLPLLSGDSRICLTGDVESRPYIDMTLAVLRDFGVRAFWENERAIFVRGGQRYLPGRFAVEGDWSNAAFLFALAGLHGESECTVKGVNNNSLQGDSVCAEYFKKLKTECAAFDVRDCPDLAPVLMTFAALNHGCVLTGTKRLKIKESDRGSAMAEELGKCGVDVRQEDNSISVEPCALHAPFVPLAGHNDHRIVMALAVLLTRLGGELEGAEAVKKSWPDFFETLRAWNVKVTYETE